MTVDSTLDECLKQAATLLSKHSSHEYPTDFVAMLRGVDAMRQGVQELVDRCGVPEPWRSNLIMAILCNNVRHAAFVQSKQPNLVGDAWQQVEGTATVADSQTGQSLTPSVAPSGLLVVDSAGVLWDDLGWLIDQCQQASDVNDQAVAWRFRRLAAIAAVCVVEAFVNGVADCFVRRGGSPAPGMRADLKLGTPSEQQADRRLSLGDKLKQWLRHIAGAGVFNVNAEPLAKVWREFRQLEAERDRYVHTKQSAQALPPVSMDEVKGFARTVAALCGAAGQCVGVPVTWLRRHRELSGA